MKTSRLLGLAIAAALAVTLFPLDHARAQTTTFFTSKGDVNLPLLPGANLSATLDNTAIGSTTSASGRFTTLRTTGTGVSSGLTCPTFFTIGAPAAATDTAFFVATRPYLVVGVSEVHAVAAGGASALQVTKDTGTNAPGAGTDLLTNNTNAGFDLNATANTVQTGAITAVTATKTLAAGDRISVDFAQAIQSSSGVAVTVCLAPL